MLERWSGAPAVQPLQSPWERHKLPLTAIAAVLTVLGIAVWLARQSVAPPVAIPTPAAALRVLKVHVAGAVVNPGIYDLPSDARVADALRRAGGALAGADNGRLNLAARLRDGQQVVVPTVPTPAPAGSAAVSAQASTKPARLPTPHPGARINLNTASQAELELLPGIGPATAKKILQHRAERGPFQSAEELKAARLVTNATWTKIQELVEAP